MVNLKSSNLITVQRDSLTLDGGDDGYYNSISSQNILMIIILSHDKGNFSIHIYTILKANEEI